MCGIWALFSKIEQTIEEQKKCFEYFNRIKNRGPDVSNLLQLKLLEQISVLLGFHRLSIIDTSPKGIQPFIKYIEKDNRTIYTLCNGEIYNYKELIEENDFDKYVYRMGSKCYEFKTEIVECPSSGTVEAFQECNMKQFGDQFSRRNTLIK